MTQNLTGRAAAAAASMGQRAAAAGVGLCSTCRHPVRLHADLGCLTGECFCTSTGAELRSGVVAKTSPAVPPSAAELALLDVMCTCGHARTGHRVNGSHVQCRTKPCSCLGFNPGGPVAPAAAPPAASAPPPVAAAPAPAAPPAAPPEPVREQPAPRPVTAGPDAEVGRLRAEHPDLFPVIAVPMDPAEDAAEIAAQSAVIHAAAPKRPRSHARPAAPALGSAAVVGEPDAVEEVAAAPPPAATAEPVDAPADDGWFRWGPQPDEVTATPGELDLTPFLSAALHYYPAWFCTGCLQRRHNPGVHCRRPLVPAYVVIAPRSEP